MDTGGGAAVGIDSARHIGKQLYTDAVRMASKAVQDAAGNLESALGESAFAHAIKDGRRPPDSLVQHLDDWYEFHMAMKANLGAAIDKSWDVYRPRFAEALSGEAGDALLASHDENVRLWSSHQDLHEAAGLAAYQASALVQNVQAQIDHLAEAGEDEFDDAVRRRDPIAALSVWRTYSDKADDVVLGNAPKITRVLQEAGFNIPLDTPPGEEDAGQNPPGKPKTEQAGSKHLEEGGQNDPTARDGMPGDPNSGGPLPEGAQNFPPPKTPAVQPAGDAYQNYPLPMQRSSIPAPLGSGSGGAGFGSGSSGGGTIGLGSGLRSPLGSVAGTSPASVMPQVPSGGSGLSPTSASPLANAGSSFQSGLASGMGATGGMGSMITPTSQPVAPLVSQQPAVASPTAGGGMGPAGVPAGSGWSGPVDSAGVSSGHGAAGGSGAGCGGAMMAPSAGLAAAQPLAPYSPPGAGTAGGIGSGALAAPTTPAGGGSAGQSGAGGAGPAGGGPGAPSVMAGNPGSSAAMSALAGSSADVNPDLLMAQRVLAGLVRGSEESSVLVVWAVAVLRSPFGSHIVVANNVGGGWYLPSKVFLPTTVRLAVCDPSLPMGWADEWMGCQKPSKILVDYFDRLRKLVAGISISAMVTTELWADPPGCGGDFLGVQHKDVVGVLSEAPKLDAAHQHRLTVIDPGVAQRVNDLDRGGDVSAWAAATLTAAVFREATNPDSTGLPLVHKSDADMLQAVNDGTANAEMWEAYDRAADQRDNGAAVWPDTYAPRDNDGSETAQAAILWYTHYYRVARMVELIRYWKARPPRLAEVAYCGMVGGFGTVVVSTLATMEQYLAGKKS